MLPSFSMSVTGGNRFSAAGSALGYIVQVEYALLLALQKMDDDVSFRVSLETADDIAFEYEGSPVELWQTKHHIDRQGSLGNASPDLWKTLHNWIEASDDASACFLLSTTIAPADSAAANLGPSRSSEDLVVAREHLNAIAHAAGNKDHASYYEKYLSLTDKQRLDLLSRVTVLDGAVQAAELTDRLVGTVRKSTVPQRRLPLIERLRGWWHGRTLLHLTRITQGIEDWIDLEEIEVQLLSIAQSLRDENLPLDFSNEPQPTPGEVQKDERVFVEQLRIIMLHHGRIRQAIYDHNRAFLQRSRWQREQLLALGELDEYDRRLTEEWNRVFLPLGEPADEVEAVEADAADARREARERYASMQQCSLPEIRSGVRSGYLPLGSLHILADRLEIGWHRDWIDLMQHRLVEVQTVSGFKGSV